MSSGNFIMAPLMSGQIKIIILYKMSYYSQPESHITNRIYVELDLSNYPTKSDLKGVAYAKTSNLTVREDLPSLKVRVDKLDVDKLKTVLADLSSITNVIDNNVLKNVVYDKLVINVNTIDTKITNIGLFLSEYTIQTNKILKKRSKVSIKRYLILQIQSIKCF